MYPSSRKGTSRGERRSLPVDPSMLTARPSTDGGRDPEASHTTRTEKSNMGGETTPSRAKISAASRESTPPLCGQHDPSSIPMNVAPQAGDKRAGRGDRRLLIQPARRRQSTAARSPRADAHCTALVGISCRRQPGSNQPGAGTPRTPSTTPTGEKCGAVKSQAVRRRTLNVSDRACGTSTQRRWCSCCGPPASTRPVCSPGCTPRSRRSRAA